MAKGKGKKYRRTPAPSRPAGGAGLAQQIQQMQQEMQQEMARAYEELADETVEVTAGGGMVTLVVTGRQRVKSITLKPEIVDPEDLEMLQDLLVAAVNQAIEQSQTMAAERLEGITGGLNIPGLM